MSGARPLRLLRRIKIAYENGLWGKRMKLYRDTRLMDDENKDEVAAASMSGNALVVFWTWIVGECVATGCFVVEYFIEFVVKLVSKRVIMSPPN